MGYSAAEDGVALDRYQISAGYVQAVAEAGGMPIMIPLVLGVQWHPERIRDAHHRQRLFAAFIDACRPQAAAEARGGRTENGPVKFGRTNQPERRPE